MFIPPLERVVQRQQVDDNGLGRRGRHGIRSAGRGRDEELDLRAAVGHAALRNAIALRTVNHRVDHGAIGANEADFADAGIEMEDEVFRAEFRLTIGDERLVAEPRQEAQWREAMTEWPPVNQVRHEQPANRHRRRFRVVDLDKVIQQRSHSTGEPFVDAKAGLVTGGRCVVQRANRRNAQCPVTASRATDGEIGELQPEFHRVQERTAIRRSVEQVEGLTGLIEAESQVKAGGTVGIGRDEREIATRRDARAGREDEAARRIQVIGQPQAGKIHRRRARIEQFNEIRERAVDSDDADIAGEHFIDHHPAEAGKNGPGARESRRAFGLPHAELVAANYINCVRPVRETVEFDGRGDGRFRTVSAAVETVAIVGNASSANLKHSGVQISRRDRLTGDGGANDGSVRTQLRKDAGVACGDEGLHAGDGLRRDPFAKVLVDQRKKVVRGEGGRKQAAQFRPIEQIELGMVEETVDRPHRRRHVDALVDVSRRVALVEDGVEVVRQDDEARISDAAVEPVVVAAPGGQRGLGVFHQRAHREVAHPQIDIGVSMDRSDVVVV